MRRSMAILVFAWLVPAPAAHATVRPNPLKVAFEGTPASPQPGVPFQGILKFEAATPIVVTGVTLAGTGWTTRDVRASATSVAPGQPAHVTFEAVPFDPDQPLVLGYVLQGRKHLESLDLSPKTVQRALLSSPSRSNRTPSPRFRPRAESNLARARLETKDASERRRLAERAKGGGASVDHDRPIRVLGRIVYDRTGNTENNGIADIVGADGVRVTIYDEDPISDEFLDEAYTDPQGFFDITFSWDGSGLDPEPDLFVHYECDAPHVKVQSADLFEVDYSWESWVADDYDQDVIDFGDLDPSIESERAALHLHTTANRAWRWFNGQGYNVPIVEVQWPETGSASYYVGTFEEIHILQEDRWSEATICHEYGHHWVENFAEDRSVGWFGEEYCNGWCDDDPDAIPADCGHCIWCRENSAIAYSEGLPDWISDVITRSLPGTYGTPILRGRSMNTLRTCNEDATFHAPGTTEGFFAALLRDIEDTDGAVDDNDPTNPWTDQVGIGTDEILDVIDDMHPLTTWEFIEEFTAAYPGMGEGLWETAKDIGFEIDVAPPNGVTLLSSLSHAPLTSSPDATVAFTWVRATDDWSGPAGYSVSFSSDVVQQPDTTQDISDRVTWTSPEIAPGTYWFNIRTVDRAGRWQDGYVSWGPFTIREPDPANLAADVRMGWASVTVPRPAGDATANSCPSPATLSGNVAATWWNTSGENTGGVATSGPSLTRLRVDGENLASVGLPIVPAATPFFSINRGPVTIRGGRHTFESFLDGGEVLAEESETDNHWALAWIWSPLSLAAGVSVTRSAPPDRTGGWEWIGPGPALYYNCDGLRMTTPGYWNATWVHAVADTADVDCRIHDPSTGPTSGFAANAGWSARAAGCLDAVLVNRNQTATASWDVGVIDGGTGGGTYTARYVVSQGMAVGDSLAVTMPAGEMLLLRDVDVQPVDLGSARIRVVTDPAAEPLHVAWFNDLFTTGDLLDADASTVTDESGVAVLTVTLEFAASHGLAIYRDPRDGAGAAIALTIEVEPSPPDFEPVALGGWYSPLVPRPAADGIANFVPPPVTLTGNAASTYINYGVLNSSAGHAPAGMHSRAFLDGVHSWTVAWSDFDPDESRGFNSATARTVRGGRHTLGVHQDGDEMFEEEDETNNAFAEQWVWSPLPLSLATPVTRNTPPQLTGGWADVAPGPPLWFNCDGLRTPTFVPAGMDGFWGGIAVMPGSGSNVDVRIHEAVDHVKNGFATNLGRSSWGPGLSDFVLVHFRPTPFRAFDAGVLFQSGGQSYTAEVVRSKFRGSNPTGYTPACTLGAQHVLQLHEFVLDAGQWELELENLSGTVTWGLAVHPESVAYVSKSDVLPNGGSWGHGAGGNEHVIVEIPVTGFYCVSVWKYGASDLAQSGVYRLRVGPATVDAPVADGPSAVAFRVAGVNPFTSRTSLAFELPSASDVRLELFDLRGARLRVLASGRHEPGRHVVSWAGTDEGGRALPAGVYLARFVGGGREITQKLVRLP